jgi:hypothetical protein
MHSMANILCIQLDIDWQRFLSSLDKGSGDSFHNVSKDLIQSIQ